ncbi:MAG: acyl--CoA ligase [Gemmatimonadetes bacterium]|nr:acyl--CoA ligase [Gemmatimonadota bacterium]
MTSDPRRRSNFGYWCDRAVRDHSDRVALIDLSSDPAREIPYAELDRRMDRVASLLASRGLRPGDRLAMAIGNRFEFVEIMYGAMRSGVVPVPLNTRLGPDTLDYIIRDAGCAGAVVDPAVCERAVGVVDDLGLETRLALTRPGGDPPTGWRDYSDALERSAESFDPPPLPDDHPCFQPYTSGSTGRPKGVVLTHAGQLWWVRCLETYWPARPDSRALAAVPLYHKNAMAGAVKPMLQAGGSVVILPDFEPRRFLRTLAEYRCTTVGAVPAVFTLLLQNDDLIETLDFGALESVKIGSAPVPEELMAAVSEALDVDVGESYGLTEGGPVMLGPPLDERPVPYGSCGVAWPEGEVKLVDPAWSRSGSVSELEDLSDGELWVRNPGVTPGYHGLDDVNADRLKDGWLATGDLFHRDAEGFFYFRGRTDDMFNSGGENIYPKEVENLLLSHEGVADAAVTPVRHPVKGHVPVAMVARRPGSSVDADALKRFTLENGPAYAHPRRVLVVDALPLSGVAKVDRAAVAETLEAEFEADLARD